MVCIKCYKYDFNATPFCRTFRGFVAGQGLRETSRGYGLESTWFPGRLPWGLPLDHVLVSKGLRVRGYEVGPEAGSDHRWVRVELGVRQWQMAPHVQPSDGVQARYSAPFAVASGLLAGAASFAQLEPAFYGSPGVRRLISVTEIVPGEGASSDDPVFSPADRVQLRLADGRVLDSGPVSHPRGHARHPLDAAQRRAKFMDCLAGSSVRDPQACHEMLSQWGQLSSVRELHLAFGA